MKMIYVVICLFVFGFTVFSQTDKTEKDSQNQGQGSGAGRGTGSGNGIGPGSTDQNESNGKTSKISNKNPEKNARLQILSKPRAKYTDAARNNKVQGEVLLRITFKKNAEIGKIKVIKGLPDGLTEQAIEAAKNMRFNPERKNDKPITVTKNLSFTFTIY